MPMAITTALKARITRMSWRVIRLTRLKISDRARERAWLQAGRTSYTKAKHRSGARFYSRKLSELAPAFRYAVWMLPDRQFDLYIWGLRRV